jgi:hypothetical protein
VLAVSFTFASNNIIDEDSDGYALTVTTSCGIVGVVLVSQNDSQADVAAMIMDLDSWLCDEGGPGEEG